MKNIYEIAKKAGIDEEYVIPYGKDKAKIDLALMEKVKNNPDGKLVLVTAITPTKAGEGKTTSSATCPAAQRRPPQSTPSSSMPAPTG